MLQSDGVDASATGRGRHAWGDKKGINLPGVAVSSPALTGGDRNDALFAAKPVDWLRASFVRSPGRRAP